MRPRLLLWIAMAAFTIGFASLAVLQHLAFWTGRFDVGNLVQAVWSTAHGDLLETTGLQGDQISRLGAHFDPAIVLLVPLWWAWPDASALLTLQAATVSLGALPVYLLARKHLASDFAGLGFALAYLLYPATQWLVLDDFHPVALATPLLLAAIWFLDEDRLLRFAVCAGLACATKEQVGLTVAALGIWYGVSHRRPRVGLAIAAAGVAVAVIAVAVVVPHFAPGGGSPFEGRYEAVGGSPAGMLETAITDPGAIVAEATDPRDLHYLFDLLWPLAGLSLLAPLLALAALPELALNLLSSTRTQTSIHFHYTAAAIPPLLAAAVLGAKRLQHWWRQARRVTPRVVTAACLAAGIVLGPVPVWRHLPFGSDLATREHVTGRHSRILEEAVALVPAGAPVSATNTLGAHLSERRRVFSFPVLGEARWVALDEQRPSALDRAVDPVGFRAGLARLRADSRFQLVFSHDGVLVFERRAAR
jgi:uncharacterized membrane protein